MWKEKIIFILFHFILQIFGSTHWIVTKNGRIEAKLESQYNMRRPNDLLALLEQENRNDEFDRVVKKLVMNKNLIDQKTEDAIHTAKQFKANNCLENLEFDGDFTIYTNGSQRVNIELYDELNIEKSNKEPRCASFFKLDHGMFAYDHLDSVNGNFELSQMLKLGINLLPKSDIDYTGKQISYGLKLNSSSWVHYNLGILFWAYKGEPKEAIECARRAIYFAPRVYKDIPLLNLAGVLSTDNGSLRDEEIILKAAIEHNPEKIENYFFLALLYQVFKESEKAINCFKIIDKKLQPKDIVSRNVKIIAQCFLGFDRVIESHHDNLQEILKFLLDFQGQQQHWLNLQNRLMWETVYDDHSFPNLLEGFESGDQKMSTLVTLGKKLEKINKMFKGNDDTLYKTFENKINDNENKLDHVISSLSENLDYTSKLLPLKYPISMKVSNQLYFDSIEWPSNEECEEWNLPLTEDENLNIPLFLPLENKGFEVETMLGIDIGISENNEHELPWYPPVCEHLSFNKNTKSHKMPRATFSQNKMDKPLQTNQIFKDHFLNYANKGKTVEEEIGQRILTAVDKKIGPTWALSILASMYWRVKLNTNNAVKCLDIAFENVPEEFKDVVYVSIASVMQQVGLLDNALYYAKLAFKVNFLEPSTNFLLAIIYYQKNNPILAMYYLKNVLRVEPTYYNGETERLLKLWACRIKLGSYSNPPESKSRTDNVCSGNEGYSTEGVVCSANGDQCKTASIQCFKTETLNNDKILPNKDCNSFTLTKESIISKFMVPQGAGNIKSEIELETIIEPIDNLPVRILFDELQSNSAPTFTFGDLYVSVTLSNDPVPEVLLHVYEKSNSYLLSESKCKEIKDSEWIYFTSMWQSIAGRNINIGRLLSPLPQSNKYSKPFCLKTDNSKGDDLDDLVISLLLKNLPDVQEESLLEWLGLISADQQSSIQELGTKISFAIKDNSSSWLLSTAASFYWRIIGNTKEAVICLQQAINNVPYEMRDIPLISLANILHRIGYYSEALFVTIEALKSHPGFVVNPFTAGNIHTSLGDYETAILFYQIALSIDPNFEPARERLKDVLCAVIFDQKGSLPENIQAFN